MMFVSIISHEIFTRGSTFDICLGGREDKGWHPGPSLQEKGVDLLSLSYVKRKISGPERRVYKEVLVVLVVIIQSLHIKES